MDHEAETRQPEPETRQPEPEARQREGEARQPEPETRQREGEARQPEAEKRQPEPETRQPGGEARQREAEMRQLEADFVATARAAGATAHEATLAAVAAELIARWSEPHRHYHNVTHLMDCLREISDPVTRLAVWGHDAIYDPRSQANEERSALLMQSLLSRCRLAETEEIARLIRMTNGHAVDADDERGKQLADADLNVLTRPWPDYLSYVDAVRDEYAHVPDELWRAGRAAILESLLALPAMFHLHPEREDLARANLRREITQLHQS